MNRSRNHSLRHMAAALLLCTGLASCSQDDLATGKGEPLQPGMYPLELTATLGSMATRATVENTWDNTEQVAIQATTTGTGSSDWSEATAYLYKMTDGNPTAKDAAHTHYWQKSGENKLVRAWHCANGTTSETVPTEWSVKPDQSSETDYQSGDLLFAAPVDVPFKKSANLNFYHQTAKVVVHVRNAGMVQTGGQTPEMKIMSVFTKGTFSAPKTAGNSQGSWESAGEAEDMTPYSLGTQELSNGQPQTEKSAASFTALVIPQTIASGQKLFSFTLGGHDGPLFYYTPQNQQEWESGKLYTYIITVKETELEVQVNESIGWDTGNSGEGSVNLYKEINGGETIDQPGNYILSGTFTQTVTLNGDNIELTLEDVTFSGGNSPIHITGGTPTIIVKGTNNSLTTTANNAAGIWLDGENSNVKITGDGSSSSCIRIESMSAAIGTHGNFQSSEGNSGNITIENVKIIANVKQEGAAAIGFGQLYGAGSNQKIGDITITNSIIEATLIENQYFPYAAVVGGCGGGEGTYQIGDIRITTSNSGTTPQEYFSKCTCGDVLVGFPPSTYPLTVSPFKIYWNGVEQTGNITK